MKFAASSKFRDRLTCKLAAIPAPSGDRVFVAQLTKDAANLTFLSFAGVPHRSCRDAALTRAPDTVIFDVECNSVQRKS